MGGWVVDGGPVKGVLGRARGLEGWMGGWVGGWVEVFRPYRKEVGLSRLVKEAVGGVVEREIER